MPGDKPAAQTGTGWNQTPWGQPSYAGGTGSSGGTGGSYEVPNPKGSPASVIEVFSGGKLTPALPVTYYDAKGEVVSVQAPIAHVQVATPQQPIYTYNPDTNAYYWKTGPYFGVGSDWQQIQSAKQAPGAAYGSVMLNPRTGELLHAGEPEYTYYAHKEAPSSPPTLLSQTPQAQQATYKTDPLRMLIGSAKEAAWIVPLGGFSIPKGSEITSIAYGERTADWLNLGKQIAPAQLTAEQKFDIAHPGYWQKVIGPQAPAGPVFGIGFAQKVSEQIDILNQPVLKAGAGRQYSLATIPAMELGIQYIEKPLFMAIPGMVDIGAELGKHPVEYGQQILRASVPIIAFAESTHFDSTMGLHIDISEIPERSPWISSGAGAKVLATGIWAVEHPVETGVGLTGFAMTGKLMSTSFEGMTTGKAGLSVKPPVPPEITKLEIGYGHAIKTVGVSGEGDIIVSRESMLRKPLSDTFTVKYMGDNKPGINRVMNELGIGKAKQATYEFTEEVIPYKRGFVEIGEGKKAVLEVQQGGIKNVMENPTFQVYGKDLSALQVVKVIRMFEAQSESIVKVDTGKLAGGSLTLEKGQGLYTVTHEPSALEEGIYRAYRTPPKPTSEVLSAETTKLFIQSETTGKLEVSEVNVLRGGFGEQVGRDIGIAITKENPLGQITKPLGLKFSLENKGVENLLEESNAAKWVSEHTLLGGGGVKTPWFKVSDILKTEGIPEVEYAKIIRTPSGNLAEKAVTKTSTPTQATYPIFEKTSVFDEDTGLYYPPVFVTPGRPIAERPVQLSTLPQVSITPSTKSYEIVSPAIKFSNKPLIDIGTREFEATVIGVGLRGLSLPASSIAQPSKMFEISKESEIELPAIEITQLQMQMQVQEQKQVELQMIIQTPSFRGGTTPPPPPPPPPPPQFKGFEIKEKKPMKSKILGEAKGFSYGISLPWADILSVQRTQFAFGGKSTQPRITGNALERWTRAAGEGFMRGFPTQEMIEGRLGKSSGLDFLGKGTGENLFGRMKKVRLW